MPPKSTAYTTLSLEEGTAATKASVPWEDQGWWRITHAFAFFLGGSTFVFGTSCYFYPDWEAGGEVAGWLYTLGSCGFLYVDVLEYFTFTDDLWLRRNISMSAMGSFWYGTS